MQGLDSMLLCKLEDTVTVEVGGEGQRRGRAEGVLGEAVNVGVESAGADAEERSSAGDAKGNLATVRYYDGGDWCDRR